MNGKNKCGLGLIIFAVSTLLCGCRTLRSGVIPEKTIPAKLEISSDTVSTAELSIAGGGAEKEVDEGVIAEVETAIVAVGEEKEEWLAPKKTIKTERALLVHDAKKKEGEKIITFDFREEKLCNALKVLSMLTHKSIIAKGKTADGEKVADIEITIFLKDISLYSAIEAICNQYGLDFRETEEYIEIYVLSDYRPPRFKMEVGDDGRIIALCISYSPLYYILQRFSAQTGLNITANEDIELEYVELVLQDVSTKTAIEVLCKKYDLWYEENADYIRLMKAEDFGKDIAVDYGVKTRIFNLKYASAPQVADSIACVMGNRVEYNVPDQLKSYEHLKLPKAEEEEGKIEQASKIATSIAKNIEAGKFEEGLTSKKLEELIGKKLELVLTSEDIRRINKELGFALMTVFIRNNTILICSTDSKILSEIEETIKKLDTPTPQVLVECKILRGKLTDDFSSFFDVSYEYLGGRELEELKMTGSPGRASSAPGETVSSIIYHFIRPGDYDFNAAIELLQKDGFIDIMGTCMLAAAQNSEAETFIGTRDWPFVTSIDATTISDDEGNITQITLDPIMVQKDIGTTLRITPQVNEDRSVSLRVNVSQTSISINNPVIPYYDATPDVQALKEYTVDAMDESSVKFIAAIPEKHTLVVGGLVTEHEEEIIERIPILGSIPLLGFFFRDRKKISERSEVIFLLTPHIMMFPEEVDIKSKEILGGVSKHFYKSIMKEGEGLYAKRQYADAEVKFKEVLEVSPGNEDALRYLKLIGRKLKK